VCDFQSAECCDARAGLVFFGLVAVETDLGGGRSCSCSAIFATMCGRGARPSTCSRCAADRTAAFGIAFEVIRTSAGASRCSSGTPHNQQVGRLARRDRNGNFSASAGRRPARNQGVRTSSRTSSSRRSARNSACFGMLLVLVLLARSCGTRWRLVLSIPTYDALASSFARLDRTAIDVALQVVAGLAPPRHDLALHLDGGTSLVVSRSPSDWPSARSTVPLPRSAVAALCEVSPKLIHRAGDLSNTKPSA